MVRQMNAVLQPLPVRGFPPPLSLAAQHFVDVGHLIKVVAAIGYIHFIT